MTTEHRPIVFITGAGASADYGFPLGRDLATNIKDLLGIAWRPENQVEFWPLVKATESLSTDQRAVASTVLRGSLDYFDSIDRLITNRNTDPNVVELGRALIAFAISRRENEMWDHRKRNALGGYENFDECFEHTESHRGWITEFVRTSSLFLSPQRADEVLSSTSFITFNYDRTIEHLLSAQLARIHGHEVMRRLIRKLEVIHVYGDLGSMLETEASDYPFGEMRIPSVKDRIRLFSDPFEENALLDRIRDRVSNAKRLGILGFGFDPLNVGRLATEAIKAQVWVTSRGNVTDFSHREFMPNLRRHGDPNGTTLLQASGTDLFDVLK